MNYLKRNIDKELLEWKNSKKRKPILLRGARQVGKTLSVQHLGEQFEYFIEINFEENKQIHSLFEGNLFPAEICENLSAVYGVPIISGKTLLFFDEIQACIPAIQSMRFFYEKMPDLHLIAAGSLLEFAISEIPSFGVGRIRSLFMFPFSFNEFLSALNENHLLEIKRKANPRSPLAEPIHEKLLSYLKKFLIIGGMPEVISTYLETRDINISRQILDDLLLSFYDDFAKYKKRIQTHKLKQIFNLIARQSGIKFVYKSANLSNNIHQTKRALELLEQAGLVIPIVHSSANGLPLGAEANFKKQKIMLLDTGLLLRILDLDINDIILSKEFNAINKGNLAEIFVGLELLKYSSPYKKNNLYYWHREAKSSNAEVDYIIVKNNHIVPIEVKAGSKGSMQSMYLFMKEKKLNLGIRVSTENFSHYNPIDVYPLYVVENIIND